MAPSDEVIMVIRGLQKTIIGIPKDNNLANRTDEKIAALQHLTELFAKSETNAKEMRVPGTATSGTPALTEVPTNESRIGVVPETNAREMRVDSTAATPTNLQPMALPPPPTEAIIKPKGPPPAMAKPAGTEPVEILPCLESL
jgi:cell division protein FtsN